MGALRFALLALIADEPMSGWDLAHAIDVRIGRFWSAHHSQIYPELARLQADGLVTHTIVLQRDRPDRKVYSLTPRGKRSLASWVTSPLARSALRDELVLRAYAVAHGDRAGAIALFREQAAAHREREAHYRRVEAKVVPRAPDPSSPGFGRWLALTRGIGFEREYAAWCEKVAKHLDGAAVVTPPNRARRARARARARPQKSEPSR